MRPLSLFTIVAITATSACSDSLAPGLRDNEAAVLIVTGAELRRLDYAGSSAAVLLRNTDLTSRLGPFWPSPDGDVVLYARTPDVGGPVTIEQLRLRGSAAPFHPAGVPAAWSPDGTRIAWTVRTYSGELIIVTDPNGDAPDTVGLGVDPVWAPDNHGLFFTCRPTNTDDEIAAFDLFGARVRVNLTNSPASDYGQRPSPDGQWIAFVSDRTPGPGIYLMRPDGTEPHRIFAGGENLRGPRWSPDSQYLAVSRSVAVPPELSDQLVVFDTSGAIHATIPFPLYGLAAFSWAPSRDVLLVLGAEEYADPLRQVWVVSHDGRLAEQLTHDPVGVGDAMWIHR